MKYWCSKYERIFPLGVSLLGMICSAAVWFWLFRGQSGLNCVLFAYAMSCVGCVYFATKAQSFFLKSRRSIPAFVFGIMSALASAIIAISIFVFIIFAAASLRERILQGGVAFYYSAGLLIFGLPIAFVIGLVYGTLLHCSSSRRQS